MTQAFVERVAHEAAQGAREMMASKSVITTLAPLMVEAGYVHRWVDLQLSTENGVDLDIVRMAGFQLAADMVAAGVRVFMALQVPVHGCLSAVSGDSTLSVRAIYNYGVMPSGELGPMLQVAMCGVQAEIGLPMPVSGLVH